MLSSVEELAKRLAKYAKTSLHQFPWRKDRTPYRVLMSELLLRKTSARQVEVIYSDFVETYSTPCVLQAGSSSELAAMLRPLGLYRRVDELFNIAKILCEKYDNVVPLSREALEALPGVGPYMSGAVLSFSLGERAAIVDTGIARLLDRYFGNLVTKKYSPHRDQKAWQKAKEFIASYPGDPAEGNYALLDVARTICKPKNPACLGCPLQESCNYYSSLS